MNKNPLGIELDAWKTDTLLASTRYVGHPTDHNDSTGFRVASADGTVPEPSTLIVCSLLGVCGIGVGWWRRRRKAV